MKKYEIVMGLEVHIELSCSSKLFCSCPVDFDAAPNENICGACSGIPGFPPVLNKRALELGIIAGLITNSEIAKVMTFDKKSYFYPDLPAGYQITQFFSPVAKNGYIDITVEGSVNRITLKQIHIEEDAGKLIHEGRFSYIDLNRAGVPLIEIVSNPDFHTAEQVIAYLEKLRSLMSFADVSDCKLQEGSMRCDVNISIKEQGQKELGTRTEIKNMSSFKSIISAIDYESKRHIEALENNTEKLIQETRGWDDNTGTTYSMREKESENDYRYFPNTEIMPVYIDDELIDTLRANLPETAESRYIRMTSEMNLPETESKLITSSKTLSEIFDNTMSIVNDPKEVLNWIIVELLSIPRGENKSVDDIVIDTKRFADLILMVKDNMINRAVGKKLLVLLIEEDIVPKDYVKENGLGMINDSDTIGRIVEDIVTANESVVNDYLGGNLKVMGFLVGQVMKNLGGKADPRIINQLLTQYISSLS